MNDVGRVFDFVSCDVEGAAKRTGLSVDVIRRAIRAGDLPVHYPVVNGRQLAKMAILAADLHEWVARGKTARAS